ncbi:MAG: SpoIIE family protein phosphatase [Bryobacteraceae bacterium]
MRALLRLKSAYRKLGWLERTLLVLLASYVLLRFLSPTSTIQLLFEIALTFTGVVVGLRLLRAGVRKATWRLRNRLVVAYLFIAVVPIVLIVLLVGIGAYLITGQIAVYMVTNVLERRTDSLMRMTQSLVATPPPQRAERIRLMTSSFLETHPGVRLLLREGRRDWHYPEVSDLDTLPSGWGNTSGFVSKGGSIYLWANVRAGGAEGLMMIPLTREILDTLVPTIGQVRFASPQALESSGRTVSRRITTSAEEAVRTTARIPPPQNRLDIEVPWFTLVPVAVWESGGKTVQGALDVTTRFSAVVQTMFNPRLNSGQSIWLTVFLVVASLFLIVELTALVIGISLTRTITYAVHNLYEGTQRVMHGDFSHRIEVRGGDQLAELGKSFNRMTENLERLVRVEKEKERLQSELEIASEVQSQLYPKSVPSMRGLELTAMCHPARIVSGDYYDYLQLFGSKLALAIGDVAGKGISAALLMATVQSSLRTQIRACLEKYMASEGTDSGKELPTSLLVSQLNQQLYSFTSPEKFATFFFGIYDDESGVLSYTNAGHPPPILVRDGEAIRLETNGIVVGAFPFAEYGESRTELRSGDLLVCFTDGITEPENEYGEMFGEDGLIDVVIKNAWRKPDEIIESVIAAVHEWTNSPEVQDDMTLLMAKKR